MNVAINKTKTSSVIAGVFGKLLIVEKQFDAQKKVI